MRDDLIEAAAAAGAEADRLIEKARALPPGERGPVLDEAERLTRCAAEYNSLLNELAAERLSTLVAGLTRIAQQETARASSIRASAEALLRRAQTLAGRQPGTSTAPWPEPALQPVAEIAPALAESPVRAFQPEGASTNGATPGGTNAASSAINATDTVVSAAAEPIDPNRKCADLSKLHPAMRKKVQRLMAALDEAGVPMRVFEAYRPPERQRHLFAQGRTRPGAMVTKADAWGSYHQYGMTVDMIIDRAGINPWEDKTPQTREWWARYHALAREAGLEPLSFEKPHVQVADLTLSDLRACRFPAGGDESWRAVLEEAARRFPEGAPRIGSLPTAAERPPLPHVPGFDGLPARNRGEWTRFGGGMEYRLDAVGVLLRQSRAPLRSDGEPLTVSRILEVYGEQIAKASRRHDVPPELILMTIATETAAFRASDFTGEPTFRWEAGCVLSETGEPDIDGAGHCGDYSAGPMQVLSTTARWMNRIGRLGHDAAAEFGWFRRKPAPAPKKLGLYKGEIAIDIGAAYIAWNRRTHSTGNDPIMVAACYNAGRLKPSSGNAWGLTVHGDHLDRAARWYGDACEVMSLAGR